MPDPIPADDLYARLGLTADADSAEIERAWRGLLKRHHPDIAGPASLEAAKRINVAHDWLSDAARRSRYDAARRHSTLRSPGSHRPSGSHRPNGDGHRRSAEAPVGRSPRRAPHAPARPSAELVRVFGVSAAPVAEFLARVAALTQDDRDRLSVSEPSLLSARVRRLLPHELTARLVAMDARLTSALGPEHVAHRRLAGSVRSFGQAIVLDAFLGLYLDDPEPLLERMRRGWESSVGFPRYGPNTTEVAAMVGRCALATEDEAMVLVRAWRRCGQSQDPWPAAAFDHDYAAMEVSAALARRDAAAGLDLAHLEARQRAAARRAFARSAHVVALKPIFGPAEFAAHHRPWEQLLDPSRAQVAARTPSPASMPDPPPVWRMVERRQARTSSSSRPT